MDLQQYVSEFHENNAEWFKYEAEDFQHSQRIRKIYDIQDYLEGKHKILEKPVEKWGGKEFEPRKIVLQYAKQILNFQVSYLISKPITLSGSENVVDQYKRIYKKGRYNRTDHKIVDIVTKYGHCFEYVYIDDGVIKSKIIKPENSYPIFSDENELIGFIEHYTSNGVSYWNVYSDKTVKQYTNKGGNGIYLLGEYRNISGLPIHYHNQSEVDDNYGRSDLDDIVSILDSMEDILSKLVDSFHKFHTPIPVSIGQQITDGSLSTDVAGVGLTLDEGSDFKLVTSKLDWKSFETIYKTLMQSLLDVSGTPSVSMNQGTPANLAEVSIKMLYSIADMRAAQNEMYLRDGMYDRFDKIRRILEYMEIEFSDDKFDSLDVVFQYARPMNETDVINNLKTLSEISGISLETILENNPYVNDVGQELERLRDTDKVNENVNDEVDVNADEK